MKIEIHVHATRRQKNGLADISIHFPDLRLKRSLHIFIEKFVALFGQPEPLICDLLIVASIVYVIDRSVSRSESEDMWTRNFEARIPVTDPKPWNRIAPELSATLSFLSGDVWEISFRNPGCPLFIAPKKKAVVQKRPLSSVNRAVSLFSGGLDSLAGAIDLLERDDSAQVMLVGHTDRSGSGAQQRRLLPIIQEKFGQRAQLFQMKVDHRPSEALESSSRCRSFLFLAEGIAAATSMGSRVPLFAHENGLIAINLPLNTARAGSCSTRTMHPYFLEGMRHILQGLHLTNPIDNPFALKTKGECMVGCLNRAVLRKSYLSSVSCAHGTRRRHWKRRKSGNCGYCIPCIFRRAALHKFSIDDGQQYGLDFCSGEIEPSDDNESSDDLRAVVDFLRRPRAKDLLAKAAYRVSPVPSPNDVGDLLNRGYDEVAALIRAKGTPKLLRASAIK
jgi:hypothetical protein